MNRRPAAPPYTGGVTTLEPAPSAPSAAPADPADPLPMLAGAGHPDGWHHVTAPGGYEWWYFDAESHDGRTQLVAIFLDGFVFHPGYLRRYFAFLKRPTKIAPPVAGDYPCAYFAVYRDGRVRRQFMTQYAPSDFEADANSPRVRIGPNRAGLAADGSYAVATRGTPWTLTARGPQLQVGQTLAAELTFRPTLDHAPLARRFLSREMTGADHHWVLAAPRCDVTGRVDLGDGETLDFAGRGYHDHNYGTGPIGPGLARWTWGRVLLADRVVGFHLAEPSDRKRAAELHLFEADAAGERDVTDAHRGDASWRWARRLPPLLSYLRELKVGRWLALTNPRVVDSSPFYLRLVYDAAAGGQRGSAFVEVAYPHRLRLPVLGRMIEMSIDKRAASPSTVNA